MAVLLALLCSQDVPALIDQLRSDQIDVRDRAIDRLIALGEQAVPALEKAAGSEDSELAGRALEILVRIEARRWLARMTPRLRRAVPDLDRRLAGSDLHTWTVLFEEVARTTQSGKKFEALEAEDLEPLVVLALRGAPPEERRTMLSWAGQERLRSGTPVYLEMALKDEDPAVRREAGWALGRVRAKEALPVLLGFAASEDGLFRGTGSVALGDLGDPRAVPALMRLLEDPSIPVRTAAANALLSLRAREAAEALERKLTDPNADVRRLAANALGTLGATASTPALRKALKDKDWSVQIAAAVALGNLRAPGVVEDIVPLFNDPRTASWAASSLGRLGDPAALPALVQALEQVKRSERPAVRRVIAETGGEKAVAILRSEIRRELGDDRADAAFLIGRYRLKGAEDRIAVAVNDPDDQVRSQALGALVVLRGEEAFPQLKKGLADPEPLTRWQALHLAAGWADPSLADAVASLRENPIPEIRRTAAVGLARMRDARGRGPLEAFLASEAPVDRQAAARNLCFLGSRKAAAALLAENDAMSFVGYYPINALRQPERVQQLFAIRFDGDLPGTDRERWKAVAAKLGQPVDVPADYPGDPGQSYEMSRLWPRMSVWDVLEGTIGFGRMEFIVEADRIRIVTRATALKFWQDWQTVK